MSNYKQTGESSSQHCALLAGRTSMRLVKIPDFRDGCCQYTQQAMTELLEGQRNKSEINVLELGKSVYFPPATEAGPCSTPSASPWSRVHASSNFPPEVLGIGLHVSDDLYTLSNLEKPNKSAWKFGLFQTALGQYRSSTERRSVGIHGGWSTCEEGVIAVEEG